MNTYKMDIAIITERHINTNHTEIRNGYTWYFSGGDTKEHNFAGVGIIINNKWANIIEDIQPINDRIMTLTFRFSPPVKFLVQV